MTKCKMGHKDYDERYFSSGCPICTQVIDPGQANKPATSPPPPPSPSQPPRDQVGIPSRRVSMMQGRTRVVWYRDKNRAAASDGISKANAAAEDDPIVGWLVATAGPAKGKDFRIKSGNNSVGRDASCRIFIEDDDAIHRGVHMTIVYDPKSNSFHIVPNQLVTSLIYLEPDPTVRQIHSENEEEASEGEYGDSLGLEGAERSKPIDRVKAVLQATRLTRYDRIHIGASKLTFVPFCNEIFGWDIL